jgi:hypothetical protein
MGPQQRVEVSWQPDLAVSLLSTRARILYPCTLLQSMHAWSSCFARVMCAWFPASQTGCKNTCMQSDLLHAGVLQVRPTACTRGAPAAVTCISRRRQRCTGMCWDPLVTLVGTPGRREECLGHSQQQASQVCVSRQAHPPPLPPPGSCVCWCPIHKTCVWQQATGFKLCSSWDRRNRRGTACSGTTWQQALVPNVATGKQGVAMATHCKAGRTCCHQQTVTATSKQSLTCFFRCKPPNPAPSEADTHCNQ